MCGEELRTSECASVTACVTCEERVARASHVTLARPDRLLALRSFFAFFTENFKQKRDCLQSTSVKSTWPLVIKVIFFIVRISFCNLFDCNFHSTLTVISVLLIV